MFGKRLKILGLLLFIIIACIGCDNKETETKEYILEDFAMNTLISIKVFSSDANLAKQALDEAFNEFKRIEALTDKFAEKNLPDPEKSDVYRINQNAGIKPVIVSVDTLLLLDKSIQYAELSEGAFDITIGPVMELWGFGQDQKSVPEDNELKNKLSLVGYEQIIINQEEKTVFLPKKGMEIDLGGIAKGYATDSAVKKLKELGITSAMINAGGNVFALGSKPDGSPWLTGIQDPRDASKIVAVVKLIDSAAVTSGDYERNFIEDGVLYHHILDPSTGKPARQGISATIVAPNATDADILSTAYFVLGYNKGMRNFYNTNKVNVLFIDNKQNIFFNQEILEQIDFVNDQDYTIISS